MGFSPFRDYLLLYHGLGSENFLMNALIHTVLKNVLAVLFPERCLGCKTPRTLFCENCRAKTKERRVEIATFPFLDRVYCYGYYDDRLLREVLRRFKYHGITELSQPLAEMLWELLSDEGLVFRPQETLLLAIPLSRERRRERGYNQAELLAESLSQKLSLPLEKGLLQRARHTPSQTGLSPKERIRNVKNSFVVSSPLRISGKIIVLVDDISTTGATLSEAARALKEGGARKVIGLVLSLIHI